MSSVLLSSAGRRVELLAGFRSALDDLGVSGDVVAADCSWYSSARHRADAGFTVPRCDDPAFVPRMLELCVDHGVVLVVPTIDTELAVLSAARDRFAAVGTTVAVSAPETVAIAADKQATHDWLATHGFPTVRRGSPATACDEEWAFPLVVKPRLGSAGHGVMVVDSPDELRYATRTLDVVVEQLAHGAEHTVDVLVDSGGACVCAVPRRRIEVRAGEVAKAVTVRSAALQELAVAVVTALPGAFGALTMQVFVDAGELTIIELNARFGGGFPLSREAGADFPRWLLEDVLGLPSTARPDDWRDGLVMLRYDAAVFVADEPGAV